MPASSLASSPHSGQIADQIPPPSLTH
jgi:hypothetical protein